MYVHGNNIDSKLKNNKKYNDSVSKKYLAEIKKKYMKWKEANLTLIGPTASESDDEYSIIEKRVTLLNQYKDFIDQKQYAEKFDARSNLHSTVLEEFMFYLFKDTVENFSSNALVGHSDTFKDIFFMPKSFRDMIQAPNAQIEEKSHDFIIGINVIADMSSTGSSQTERISIKVPAVAIECKTYVDKTMIEGASSAGAQLTSRNPNALYIVVAEWLKLTESINLKKYQVDQIYVLRKQKNTDREFRLLPSYDKQPIYPDTVYHLFRTVRNHLLADWYGGVAFGLERGYLI